MRIYKMEKNIWPYAHNSKRYNAKEFGDSISIYPGDVFSPAIQSRERKRVGQAEIRDRIAKNPYLSPSISDAFLK